MRRAALLLRQVPLVTHEVTNQVPLLQNFDAFASNQRLQECVAHYRGAAHDADSTQRLHAYGALVGSAEFQEHARLCNENPPQWSPFDCQGRRIDTAVFHPSYHEVLGAGVRHGVPSSAHAKGVAGAHVFRMTLSMLHYQLEQGTGCPLTMTFAAVAPLARNNEGGAFTEWLEKLQVREYDRRDGHISLKRSVQCGMSMTEKQGGSDVRSNTTTATPVDAAAPVASGAAFSLRGHKWFTSAPMCDAFLTLAQTKSGLSCFLVPRWLSPTERNVGLQFMRLKGKLGDRSNASSEVEYRDAVGFLVGEEGRGVPNIIEMVNLTRLDCLMGSAALMQAALVHAIHHAQHRKAFGCTLSATPLMRNVLCDLALEAEAAEALAARVTHSFDNRAQVAFKRIATAIGKYYVCKRAPAVVYECLECLGGNGYVEDFPLARFFRQSPLNAIWEGSGNVIVLDVFRALTKDSAALDAIREEIHATGPAPLASAFEDVARALGEGGAAVTEERLAAGRIHVERLAVLLQAAALYRCGPRCIADAFLGERVLRTDRAALFGTLLPTTLRIADELLERNAPRFVNGANSGSQ